MGSQASQQMAVLVLQLSHLNPLNEPLRHENAVQILCQRLPQARSLPRDCLLPLHLSAVPVPQLRRDHAQLEAACGPATELAPSPPPPALADVVLDVRQALVPPRVPHKELPPPVPDPVLHLVRQAEERSAAVRQSAVLLDGVVHRRLGDEGELRRVAVEGRAVLVVHAREDRQLVAEEGSEGCDELPRQVVADVERGVLLRPYVLESFLKGRAAGVRRSEWDRNTKRLI
ncbi:hypothetical protein THAOC_32590 [Thalassiosira oceanica]|uniref:Uncharacterized protein n=1 Tax=Thalassiosira oceanica TaxID=159749 RepID=K0R8X0_THAOC|nr:hypothetical protein THAOC_32590 [Thalassiosira oceanica]|eukprot:EJK48599.1 hypothetical protein THAOC_32590 [Thalassiosira oceanica]